MERYLQQVLRNWANQQKPPANARARLLLMAGSHSYPLEEPARYLFEEHYLQADHLYNRHRNEPDRILDLLWIYHLPMPALRMV